MPCAVCEAAPRLAAPTRGRGNGSTPWSELARLRSGLAAAADALAPCQRRQRPIGVLVVLEPACPGHGGDVLLLPDLRLALEAITHGYHEGRKGDPGWPLRRPSAPPQRQRCAEGPGWREPRRAWATAQFRAWGRGARGQPARCATAGDRRALAIGKRAGRVGSWRAMPRPCDPAGGASGPLGRCAVAVRCTCGLWLWGRGP